MSFKSRDIKILRFWVLGFQGFATYQNFKVLGFQSLVTIKILRSWVFRVSLPVQILRCWVSRVLRHNTILRSWVSRVPRQKGRARSKIHQGPRPWTQRTQDLEPFWNLGTSLTSTYTGYRVSWRGMDGDSRATKLAGPGWLAGLERSGNGLPALRPHGISDYLREPYCRGR